MPQAISAVAPSPSHYQLLRDLREELEGKGLLTPSGLWRRKLLLWIPAFVGAYLGMLLTPVGPLWLLLAPLASVALLTMGFAGHDAGHGALSRKAWVNGLWGQITMTLMCGMSFGSWRSRHNLHHSRCQQVDGDPDMHFGVLFSVYPESSNWQTPLGRFFLRMQKWAFWPLSSFYWVALGYDGIRDIFQRPKDTKVDRFLIPLHWLGLLIIPGLVLGWPHALLAFVTMSCLVSLMTASVFIPNHIGMRRLEPGQKLSYLEQQVTTSRDIDNPRVLDFYYGGLNSQIEHHLFPRASHDRYREMRPVVQAFCEKNGLAYERVGLYRALASVGNHLGSMTAAYHAKTEVGAAAPLTPRTTPQCDSPSPSPVRR
jgi:fatty acid desaturase